MEYDALETIAKRFTNDLMDFSLEQIEAVLLANSFSKFVEKYWSLVSQDKFVRGYHIDAICEHLQAIADGKIKRLVINVAIRHTKSLLCSVLFPVYLWLKRPEARIITATYSKDLTVRDAVRSRQLIEQLEFQSRFPHLHLVDDSNRKDYYQNSAQGHRLSVSIGSRTTGFDADFICVDDIHDMATRNSEAERNNAIDYFETALSSRLVYTGREAIVVAGHRVHEDDLYSRLRAKYSDDGSWSWLVLPEEYNPKFAGWYNGIGWKDRRQEGELLWKEKFSRDVLEQEKKRYRHEYSTIFQQEPVSPDGHTFKSAWFKHYQQNEEEYILGEKHYSKSKAVRFAVCDTAISTSSTADYTVVQVYDIVGCNFVLVDQLRRRLDGVKIVPTVAEFVKRHNVQWISVEAEFVGKFVADQLRGQHNLIVRNFSAKKHGDKETRAISAEIRLEAGQIWFPSRQGWVADLESELLGFPNGAHDDQVDCLSICCLVGAKYLQTEKADLSPEEQAVKAKEQEDKRFREIMFSGIPKWLSR